MFLEYEILINQFAQSVKNHAELTLLFESLNVEDQRNLIKDIEHMIIQSRCMTSDIDKAIQKSGLKPSFTPCVILKQGLGYNNFFKVIHLPQSELKKAFILVIYLFKEGYLRRFEEEKNNPNKWWYWDLSSDLVLQKIREQHKKKASQQ